MAGGYAKVSLNNQKNSIIYANYGKHTYLAYFVLPSGEVWWWNAELFPQEQTKEDLQKITNKQWQEQYGQSLQQRA